MLLLKKDKQRQYHAYVRYFSLLRGFRVKLFVLIKAGGIYIFIKIESEIRIFDFNKFSKRKNHMQVRPAERTNEVWQKKF